MSFAPVTLHGRRLGSIEGRRVSSSVTLERCTQIELDFVPGRYGQPAQARIRHSAWNGALRRWEGHVALLIQDADLLDQLPIHPVG